MTPEEFRENGYKAIDWIASYLENIEGRPVLSKSTPGQVRSQLPASPPANGESFEQILRSLDEIILPGITHWQSPNFFAFFPANNSGPSILGELISAGLGVQGMMWATSPACTELEAHMLDWLVEALALPDRFRSTNEGGGVIQDSASSASLCALLAARERCCDYESNLDGNCQPLVCYASDQAHSSIEKAMMIAGLGRNNLRKIGTDSSFRLSPAELEEAIVADLDRGLRPCFVAGTVGTTSTGAIDPLPAVGEICSKHGVWFHVDAAMYGTAGLCQEFRHIFDGLELADSYCFNPHKWMMVNFDCCCFFVADRTALVRALSISPEYLKNAASDSGEVIDYRDWQIPLGRRFRALKLWFVIRSFGTVELQRRVREHVALAQDFAAWVDRHPEFQLCAPTPLNLVCFRHSSNDARNQELIQKVNASGRIYLTHTRVNEQFTLRMSIGQSNTQARHVSEAWQQICAAAKSCA